MHRKRTKLTRSPHCGQYLMLFDAVSLTKKAEPPPTRDVNRDSGTASANGGWLRRLVRLLVVKSHIFFRKPRITKTAVEIMIAFSTKAAKQAIGFGPDANGCQIW